MKNQKRIEEYGIALLIALIFTGLVFLMTGCNTIGGIGKDISAAADGTKQHLIEN